MKDNRLRYSVNKGLMKRKIINFDERYMEFNNEIDYHCSNSYGDNVETVLAKLQLKVDILDEPHFDVVAYINEAFPNEQSLSNIDDVILETRQSITDLDEKITNLLRKKWQIEDNSPEIIEEAMKMIKTLVLKIEDVQDRATKSEKMVRDITQDIQQLDQAKRNLTVSITVLNNLILIVNVLDHLNSILNIGIDHQMKNSSSVGHDGHGSPPNPFLNANATKNQPHASELSQSTLNEVVNLLSQAQRLIEPMFVAYGTVPSIAGLSAELDVIHSNLEERLTRELKSSLSSIRIVENNASVIQLKCSIIDLLPQSCRIQSDLLNWFILRHLAEYKELFEPTQTIAWLDKMDHRFNWLKSNFGSLEHLFKRIFPSSWLASERYIGEFCRLTHADLKVLMKRRQSELTHNLIVFALQRTLAFESNLNKTYEANLVKHGGLKDLGVKRSTNPFDDDDDGGDDGGGGSLAVAASSEKKKIDDSVKKEKQTFEGVISSVFDDYFDLYLAHVDKVLKDQLTNRLVGDFTVNKSSFDQHNFGDDANDTANLKSLTLSDPGANTLASATELFLLFKQIIKQTLQLNRSQGLMGLVRVLRQYTSEYTGRVLLSQIPGVTDNSTNAGTSAASDVTTRMAAFGLSSLSALGLGRTNSNLSSVLDNVKPSTKLSIGSDNTSANHLLASILRDDAQTIRLNKEEVYKVCVILVTAVFCLKTIEDLEKRLKMEIRPLSWNSKISFAPEVEDLVTCRSVCVHRLISDMEATVEPHLLQMTHVPWGTMTQVGDQSAYISAIVNYLKVQIPLIRDTLYTVRSTFTQICIKFTDAFVGRFVNSLYRCKPVSTFGAEQLLLDTQSMKTALLQMPLIGSKVNQAPPRSFLNLVHEGMGRAERIIKAVMLPVGTTSLQHVVFEAPTPSSTTTHTAGGFVTGSVDEHSVTAFLTSYSQLILDSTESELQKILDMKGIKHAEQQIILDIFNKQSQLNADNRLVNSESG